MSGSFFSCTLGRPRGRIGYNSAGVFRLGGLRLLYPEEEGHRRFPGSPAARRLLHLTAVLCAYLGLAVCATWPLARDAADHVFGAGTPPLNVWAIGFVLHQLPRDPLHLFDGNVFHPYPATLAFSEHLFVPALQAAPVVWATDNLVLAHNVVALITMATAGLGAFLLARAVTGDSGPPLQPACCTPSTRGT